MKTKMMVLSLAALVLCCTASAKELLRQPSPVSNPAETFTGSVGAEAQSQVNTWQIGISGSTVTATLNGGTLTISGSGKMYVQPNRSFSSFIPWYDRRESVTTVIIQEGVTNISPSAFANHANLRSVRIAPSVTAIGMNAFNNCSLTEIVIPNSVTVVEDDAFSGNDILTKVVLEDGKTPLNFGYAASKGFFTGCPVESIYLGRNVRWYLDFKSDGRSPFKNNTKLRSVTIGDYVTEIRGGVFYGCTELVNVKLGSNITTIGFAAFQYTGIAGISFPDGVTTISESAFADCELAGISIPNSVTTIGAHAFASCGKLKKVRLEEGKMPLQTGDGAFDKTPVEELYIGRNMQGAWNSIPPVFNNNTKLKTVVFGDKVTSIGNNAFAGCTALTRVVIGAGITSIGSMAFQLTELTQLQCKNPTPPTVGRDCFNGVNKAGCRLFVPSGSQNSYQSADEWKDFYITVVNPQSKPAAQQSKPAAQQPNPAATQQPHLASTQQPHPVSEQQPHPVSEQQPVNNSQLSQVSTQQPAINQQSQLASSQQPSVTRQPSVTPPPQPSVAPSQQPSVTPSQQTLAKPEIKSITYKSDGVHLKGVYSDGTQHLLGLHTNTKDGITYQEAYIDAHGDGTFDGLLSSGKLEKGVEYRVAVVASNNNGQKAISDTWTVWWLSQPVITEFSDNNLSFDRQLFEISLMISMFKGYRADLVFIGHSMGGLTSINVGMAYANANKTRNVKIITLDTPYQPNNYAREAWNDTSGFTANVAGQTRGEAHRDLGGRSDALANLHDKWNNFSGKNVKLHAISVSLYSEQESRYMEIGDGIVDIPAQQGKFLEKLDNVGIWNNVTTKKTIWDSKPQNDALCTNRTGF